MLGKCLNIDTGWIAVRFECQIVCRQRLCNGGRRRVKVPSHADEVGTVSIERGSKGQFTVLAALHIIMCNSADFESSRVVNSGAIMHRHMPHCVLIDGINGSAGLCWLLTCEHVLWGVTPSKQLLAKQLVLFLCVFVFVPAH